MLSNMAMQEKTFMHGIGLSNVKREVEKYMGDMDIKYKKMSSM